MFDLNLFLATPSISQINSCRKDDLAKIADHFNISYSKQLLKRELKALIIDRLVEMEVIVLPEISESAVLEDGTLSEEVCDQKLGGEPHGAPTPVREGQAKTPVTLPRYDPLSPTSSGSRDEARVKVRIACLRMESQEKVQNRQAQLQYQLEIQKLEIEADKAIKLRQLELQSQREMQAPHAGTDGTGMSSLSTTLPRATLDISKHIALVPTFREAEVDSYFAAFERIASALQWPPEVWPLLIQCKSHGKAQEAVAALPLEDSLDYDSVKAAILRAYELVPEAYRQKFRNHKKAPNQTYAEFTREKGTLFDKWSNSCQASDFDSLRELLLLEDFKKCLLDCIVVYLNEQKVKSLSAAAVLADEYVLTHKSVFPSASAEKPRYTPATQPSSHQAPATTKHDRECYYCHRPGHVIAECRKLKNKMQKKKSVTATRHRVNSGRAARTY